MQLNKYFEAIIHRYEKVVSRKQVRSSSYNKQSTIIPRDPKAVSQK